MKFRTIFLALLLCLSSFPAGAKETRQADQAVAARVGDRVITIMALEAEIRSARQSKENISREQALDRLIEKALFAVEAARMDLDKDPAVALQLQNAREAILARAYLKTALAQAPRATDREVEGYYKRHMDQFIRPEQVRASHILFRVARTASAPEVEKARALCLSVKKRIDEGEDFAALARQFSQDPGTGKKGGDLFDRNGKIKALSDPAFSMEPGQVAGPIRSALGYHLLKVTDRQASGPLDLEQVQNQIRNTLNRKKGVAHLKAIKTRLAGSLDIEKMPVPPSDR